MDDIKTILADPEFQSAPVADQREVLKSIDADFGQLNDDALREFTKSDVSSASSRLSKNKSLNDLIGGELLNPDTNEPVYSEDQKNKDEISVGKDLNSNILSKLKNQVQADESLQKTGKLTSALAGAASVPLGMANLASVLAGKLLGNKDLNQALPLTIPEQESTQQVTDTAAQNPISAAIGSALYNAPAIASGGISPGGNILNTAKGVKALASGDIDLAKSLGTQVLKESIPSAAVNAGINSGIRSLSGQDTSGKDLLMDALTGVVLGGDNPEATNQLKTSIQEIPKTIKSVAQAIPSPFSVTQFKAATQALRPANKIGTTWNEEFVGKGLGAIKDLGGVDIATAAKDEAVGSFIKAANNTLGKINNAIKSVTDNPNAVEVEGSPILDGILQAVANDKSMAERPEEVQAILDDFKIYNRPIPLDEAERLLEHTNAELFGPLYNRTVEGKKVASQDLQIKAQQALAEGLRDQINAALDTALGNTGKGAELKKTYGAVATMKREAQKRYLVALRQAQNSLPEQLSYANSAADIVEGLLTAKTGGLSKILSGTARSGVAKAIKDLNTSDSMIRTAFGKTPEGQSVIAGQEFPQAMARPKYTPEDVAYAIKLRKERLGN